MERFRLPSVMAEINISMPLDEIKRENILSKRVVDKILYSKRLLVDHVESLESCILEIQETQLASKPEIFTLRNASCILAGTLVEHLITPRSLKFTMLPSVIFTGGFGALFLTKQFFNFRNKLVERELDNLIKSIDDFGNCIKRNITYFNEILAMKASELVESRQIERAWDCITSAKEVVEILYDATRKLEERHKLPPKFSEYYSPMEELRESDYFKKNVTDYTPKNIKDFYNIYAYVQSQFLLRLALTASQNASVAFLREDISRIENEIQQHVNEEESHFKNLSVDLKKKQQIDLAHPVVAQGKSGPVEVLKTSSLKLNSCMVAVADQCQQLDGVLQRLTEAESTKTDDGKHLLEVANSMRLIEASLSVCCDDFHRLMLVYNKFLSSRLDNKLKITQYDASNGDNNNHDEHESILRVEIDEDYIPENKDDFYAYMQSENARENDERDVTDTPENSLLNFEDRVTKSKFKPVLLQLKTRIDPIRRDMLEKERKVLAAKGFNVDELLNKEPEVIDKSVRFGTADSGSESDDGSLDEREGKSKRYRVVDNYNEMRDFLAQKQRINLFQLEVPRCEVEEEILE